MGTTLTGRVYIGVAFAVIVALGIGMLCWKLWAKENSRRAVVARSKLEAEAQTSGNIEMRDVELGEPAPHSGEEKPAQVTWHTRWFRG